MRRLFFALIVVMCLSPVVFAALELRQSTAVNVVIGPFFDPTDGITREAGLTIKAADIVLSKNGGAFAAKNNTDDPCATGTAGWYIVTLNTIDTDTLGILKLDVRDNDANTCGVWSDFEVVSQQYYDAKYGTGGFKINWANVANPTSTVGLSGTTIGTITTYTGNTPQTGDVYAKLPSNFSSFHISSVGNASADVNLVKGQSDSATNLDTFWDDGGQFANIDDFFDGTGYAGGTIKLKVVDQNGVGIAIHGEGGVAQTGNSYAIVNHATYGNAQLLRAKTPDNAVYVSAVGNIAADSNLVGGEIPLTDDVIDGIISYRLGAPVADSNTNSIGYRLAAAETALSIVSGYVDTLEDIIATLASELAETEANAVLTRGYALAAKTASEKYDTDAEHATAIWNAATGSYGSAGSYGLLIETNLDAKVSTSGGAGDPNEIWPHSVPYSKGWYLYYIYWKPVGD